MNFSTTLTGLINASDRMNEAARDITRATLPPIRAQADPTPPAAAANGENQADLVTSPGDASAADLPDAMVRQIQASLSFMAGVQALKREDETLQSLLDKN